jgi:2'-5' RNA ligase
MPNITLIYPFCEPSQFQSVAKATAAQCQDVVPFDVSLTTFNTFTRGKGYYTVWLTPEPYEALRDLHAAVWTAVSHDEDYEPRFGRFTPHLSVGQLHGRKQREEELLRELADGWQPVTFRVSEVHFVARGDPPDDVFRVSCTIRLGEQM